MGHLGLVDHHQVCLDQDLEIGDQGGRHQDSEECLLLDQEGHLLEIGVHEDHHQETGVLEVHLVHMIFMDLEDQTNLAQTFDHHMGNLVHHLILEVLGQTCLWDLVPLVCDQWDPLTMLNLQMMTLDRLVLICIICKMVIT